MNFLTIPPRKPLLQNHKVDTIEAAANTIKLWNQMLETCIPTDSLDNLQKYMESKPNYIQMSTSNLKKQEIFIEGVVDISRSVKDAFGVVHEVKEILNLDEIGAKP